MTRFTKAIRAKAFFKLAIMGVSGSGKTYSALLLARGLVGKRGRIAVIDTENNSSTLYDTVTDFDQCAIAPRANGFHYRDFIDAIREAEAEGYDCIVIDSFSHLWQAILSEKETLDRKPTKSGTPSNSFTNWAQATKDFNEAVQTVLQCKAHVIACMRSKTEYVLNPDKTVSKGKGRESLAPIMRDGIEYEFTTVFDLNESHQASIPKDRTGLFAREEGFVITENTGKKISEWVDGGADTIDRNRIYEKVKALVSEGGLLQEEVIGAVKSYGKDKMLDLDDESFVKVAKSLGVAIDIAC
jgi:hypothetical protein